MSKLVFSPKKRKSIDILEAELKTGAHLAGGPARVAVRCNLIHQLEDPHLVHLHPAVLVQVVHIVPVVGAAVRITGTVYDDNFKEYQLQYGIGEDPPEWHEILIENRFQSILNDQLAIWHTTELPDTVCTLRLRAYDLAEHMSEDTRIVHVKKELVTSSHGGTFQSVDSLLTVYIPPRAVEHYTSIFINKVDDVPPVQDSGVRSVGVSYRLEPEDIVLKKPGILSIKFNEEGRMSLSDDSQLSVYL